MTSPRLKMCAWRLPGGKFDFLFIDGDHSYEGVRRDFELYSPLAEVGALVAFHDIVPSIPGGHGDPGDVPAFWGEIKNAQTVEAEFVEDPGWGSVWDWSHTTLARLTR